MSWLAIHIPINAHHIEPLSEALFNLGALSVSIEDAQAGTAAEEAIFGEPGEPVEVRWKESSVTALFDKTIDADIIVAAAINQLNIALPPYQVEDIEETDWVRATQAQFDPIAISPRLWITPSWHAAPKGEDTINLVLDPGLAFGTGSHPTTRLCLQWLDKQILIGKSLLDYGCGSGILSIAAMKLKAKKVEGIDIDPQAILASRQNAVQNGVDIAFYLPDDAPQQQYDIVIANILTNPLKALAPLLANRCLPGGEIVLSGILSEQSNEVIAVYQQWFDLAVMQESEGWALIHGCRH
jgi:ribosomal protein L11 methyltransferase